MKILVIDDETELRGQFRKILEAEGHEVYEAEGAHDALRNTAVLDSCDLIITDMRMPSGSGLDFLQTYSRTTSEPKPVLVHSSSNSFKDRGTPWLHLPEDIPKSFPFAEFRSKLGSQGYILDFVERYTP